MQAFHKKYNLEQRKEKSKKQMQQNPGKLPIIAEPHPKSKLPHLSNPKFLCESHYKFNVISTILSKKIQKMSNGQNNGNNGGAAQKVLFLYINKNIINGEQKMDMIYQKYKNQDGFLYVTYGQMQTFGGKSQNQQTRFINYIFSLSEKGK